MTAAAKSTAPSMLDVARECSRRGWCPVPIRRGSKAPVMRDWPNFRPGDDNLSAHFSRDCNIGIILGSASGGLCDVDLDSPEALAVADSFLPPTNFIFGRPSKPRSHRFYIIEARNPLARPRPQKFCAPDGSTLIEFRADGQQTVVPPSLHPSGELYEFAAGDGTAAVISGPEIARAFQLVAAATLLAHYWPTQGTRHDAALALAGMLARSGWRATEIENFLRAIGEAAHDEELKDRLRGADSTLRRVLEGQPATGTPTLAQIVSNEVVSRVREWLQFDCRAEVSSVVAGSSSSFNLTPLSLLLEEPEESVAWLLDGILPAGGLSLLAAKPKTGKSTFARCLSLAVARGEQFLQRATQKGAVIYLALEEKRSEIRSHFRAMGASSEGIFVHAAQAPADAVDAVAKEIQSRCAVLLIIDPLFRFSRVRDGNDYAEISRAFEPLIKLARENSVHVLVVHHLRKGSSEEPTDSILGSTALFASVDTAVLLKRTEKYRTVQTCQRYGCDLPETVLLYDAERRWVSVGGTRLEADRGECEARILEFLESAVEPQTQAQIREGVQGQTKIVRAALTVLAESGRVQKSGDGTRGKPFVYGFPNSGSHSIPRTRKPEIESVTKPTENTTHILVPEDPQKAFLVLDKKLTQQPGPSGSGEPFESDAMEI